MPAPISEDRRRSRRRRAPMSQAPLFATVTVRFRDPRGGRDCTVSIFGNHPARDRRPTKVFVRSRLLSRGAPIPPCPMPDGPSPVSRVHPCDTVGRHRTNFSAPCRTLSASQTNAATGNARGVLRPASTRLERRKRRDAASVIRNATLAAHPAQLCKPRSVCLLKTSYMLVLLNLGMETGRLRSR
jgi:hypothetical protein